MLQESHHLPQPEPEVGRAVLDRHRGRVRPDLRQGDGLRPLLVRRPHGVGADRPQHLPAARVSVYEVVSLNYGRCLSAMHCGA